MKNQKAIQMFQNCIDNKQFVTNFEDALKKAIEALEKQIPEKPMLYNNHQRMCECGVLVQTYQNYCYNCGRALDWSESNG